MQGNSEKKGVGQALKKAFGKFWNMSESGIIILFVVYTFAVYLRNHNFLSLPNVNSFLRQGSYYFIAAIGMTFVLIAGGIDLSVGSVLGWCGMICGISMVYWQWPIWLCILFALLNGAVMGFINGSLIVKFRLPPMIMTLGMMYIGRGLCYVVTNGYDIYPMPDAFNALEQTSILNIPVIVYYAVILCIIFSFVLKQTAFGRKVFAIGGNRDAAKLAGINVKRVTVGVYTLSGLTAALMGILMDARLGGSKPGQGDGYEMYVIASCIIGGCSTYGGMGTMLGSLIGAIFMNMLTNSMSLMRINANWQKAVIGCVLILAVIWDDVKRTMAEKRAAGLK